MNAVHGDDSGYVVFGAMIGTHVGDEVSPSGFADERDFRTGFFEAKSGRELTFDRRAASR